jgi:hypothetical protein
LGNWRVRSASTCSLFFIFRHLVSFFSPCGVFSSNRLL